VYLTKEQILLIHSLLIDEIGGSHGVRDRNAVLSLEELLKQKAFGKELYPTIFIKATLYARTIIMNHPFIDGNKRTGMTAAATFLEYNGYYMTAQEGEIQKFTLEIIHNKCSLETIAEWFKKHSKKLKK